MYRYFIIDIFVCSSQNAFNVTHNKKRIAASIVHSWSAASSKLDHFPCKYQSSMKSRLNQLHPYPMHFQKSIFPKTKPRTWTNKKNIPLHAFDLFSFFFHRSNHFFLELANLIVCVLVRSHRHRESSWNCEFKEWSQRMHSMKKKNIYI